jgi:hypothetical protein
VTRLPRRRIAIRVRLAIAIGLGVVSVAGSLLLVAADAIRGTVTWAHHSPASAAPLFLIAAAIAAASIGRPPEGRHGLLRLVAVLAFTAWGTGQVAPPAAAGAFNDAAILLFIIDAASLVVTEARARLAWHRKRPVQPRRNTLRQCRGHRHRATTRQPELTVRRDLDARPLPPRLRRQSDLMPPVPTQRV